MTNLVPKQIVDVNGKQTTVHVKPDFDVSAAKRKVSGIPPIGVQQPLGRHKNTLAVISIIEDEWSNYDAMIREASMKDRDVPDEPTWGSLLDSLDQMPDEIIEDITGGHDANDLREALIELAIANGFDTELPSDI